MQMHVCMESSSVPNSSTDYSKALQAIVPIRSTQQLSVKPSCRAYQQCALQIYGNAARGAPLSQAEMAELVMAVSGGMPSSGSA